MLQYSLPVPRLSFAKIDTFQGIVTTNDQSEMWEIVDPRISWKCSPVRRKKQPIGNVFWESVVVKGYSFGLGGSSCTLTWLSSLELLAFV